MLSQFSQAGFDYIYNPNCAYFHRDYPKAKFPEAVSKKCLPLCLFKYTNKCRFLERINEETFTFLEEKPCILDCWSSSSLLPQSSCPSEALSWHELGAQGEAHLHSGFQPLPFWKNKSLPFLGWRNRIFKTS